MGDGIQLKWPGVRTAVAGRSLILSEIDCLATVTVHET